MSALSHALWALAIVALGLSVRGLVGLGERLAPGWLVPAHRALALPSSLIAAATLLILDASLGLGPALASLDPIDQIGAMGFARHGPAGGLVLFALGLALFLGVYLLSRLGFFALRPRAAERSPVPGWMAWLGVLSDGSEHAAARRAVSLVALLVFVGAALSLAWWAPSEGPATPGLAAWVAGLLGLVGWLVALAPAPRAQNARRDALAADTSSGLRGGHPPRVTAEDPEVVAGLLARLGHPPLIANDPGYAPEPSADGLWSIQREALERAAIGRECGPVPGQELAPARAPVLAIAGPAGSGKRTAALILASQQASVAGRRVAWIGPTPLGALEARLARVRPDEVGLVALEVIDPTALALDRAVRWGDPPAVVVIEVDRLLNGVALARLRYALHRLAGHALRVPVVVLGSAPGSVVLTAARAVAAAEPSLVLARGEGPSAPVRRHLVEPDAEPRLGEVAELIRRESLESLTLVPVERPLAWPRYPDLTASASVMTELVTVPGGPGGRRARAWVQGGVSAIERRLVVALPGDREVPERRLRSARLALRKALSDGPPATGDAAREARLIEVFSRRLLKAELAALASAGRLEGVVTPTDTHGGDGPPNAADVGDERDEGDEMVVLVEPRSGKRVAIARETVELEAFEGAIVDGHEVALGIDGERLLVPTRSVRSSPLRRLRFSPVAATNNVSKIETTMRHRFAGEAALEVRTTRLMLSAIHVGVRRFESGERRAHTTMLEVPRLIAPRQVEAVILVLDAGDAVSEAALHALTHALAEVLPWVVENASDLGASYVMAGEGGLDRSAIVLWDRHPDGLGAVHDLRPDDLYALLGEARALLATCGCESHCASCCESAGCTSPEVPLDRHAALRLIEPLFVKRSAAPPVGTLAMRSVG